MPSVDTPSLEAVASKVSGWASTESMERGDAQTQDLDLDLSTGDPWETPCSEAALLGSILLAERRAESQRLPGLGPPSASKHGSPATAWRVEREGTESRN